MSLLFQNTEFTCGPVCLKMAMRRLDPARPLEEINEYLIWREANSIFMGEGHPGCTHYGLANAALGRGFAADIYSNDIAAIDAQLQGDVLTDKEREIYDLINAHDRAAAEQAGLKIHRRDFDTGMIDDLLRAGKSLLMMVRAFSDHDEHWILIDRIEDGGLLIVDPLARHVSHGTAAPEGGGATHRLDDDDVARYCLHGAGRAYLVLSIGRAGAQGGVTG